MELYQLKIKNKGRNWNLLKDPSDMNSVLVEIDKENVEACAEYFSSVFTSESLNPILALLNHKMLTEPLMEMKITEEFRKILEKLKINKSPGPYEMHPHFLWETAAEIEYPLNIIFIKSLESKSVPVQWKKGRITALFKKGSKKLASTYKSVTLTSKVCKCLEKLVREHIIGYMEENNLLSKKQYDFSMLLNNTTAINSLE